MQRDTAQNSEQIMEKLQQAYQAEFESAMNYLANAQHLDGVHAEPIKASLNDEVDDEMGHAKKLAERIDVLGGTVPSSTEFEAQQSFLKPPTDSTDVESVVGGVLKAEKQAIDMYNELIALCRDTDPVTEDLAIELLADEQRHFNEFSGYMADIQRHAIAS